MHVINLNVFLVFLFSFYFISDEIKGAEKNIFLSTKYNEVNIRKGPGSNHYIVGVLQKKGIPLKIIGSFDSWVKIKDFEGEVGWVSKTQLSEKKFGIVLEKIKLQQFPKKNSKVLPVIQKNILIKIKKCRLNWCKVDVKNFSGWVKINEFWGAN